MSTQTESPRPDAAGTAGVERRFVIETTAGPDATVRILIMLRRRRCAVTHIQCTLGDAHHPSVVTLSVRGDPRRLALVRAWLANIVDVVQILAQ